jgi:hypothetical protein
MPDPAATELERLRYRHGQMLRSRDARDQVRIQAQLRWWHNRALHQAFGVVEGLRVVDGQQVTVEPGLAYDCFGRELLQPHLAAVAVPATDEALLLLASYDETAATERLAFAWRPPRGVGIRDGVPLARLTIASSAPLQGPLPDLQPLPGALRARICHDAGRGTLVFEGDMTSGEHDQLVALSDDKAFVAAVGALFASTPAPLLDPCFRPAPARALARPRVAAGATIPGATAWEPWTVGGGGFTQRLGIQVRVDTSSAGFTDVPCYFAWVQGAVADERARPVLAAHLSHVHSPSATGFGVRLWLLETSRDEPASLARRQEMSVCWLGIQTSSEVNHGHP